MCETALIEINDSAYPLDAFPIPKERANNAKRDAAVDAGQRADAGKGKGDASASEGSQPKIKPDGPRLAKLDAKWIALGFEGQGIAENYGGDRSKAVFAFTCECVRAGIADDIIAACLIHWKIGEHIRDQSNVTRALERTIQRAHQFVENSKLSEMNELHCVLPIGGKTRVATWGDDLDFPGRQIIVRTSSLADFKALQDKYRYTYEGKDAKGNAKVITAAARHLVGQQPWPPPVRRRHALHA